MSDSYLKNCLVIQTADQVGPMFQGRDNGDIAARLDGYAIVPLELYAKMLVALGYSADDVAPDWWSSQFRAFADSDKRGRLTLSGCQAVAPRSSDDATGFVRSDEPSPWKVEHANTPDRPTQGAIP